MALEDTLPLYSPIFKTSTQFLQISWYGGGWSWHRQLLRRKTDLISSPRGDVPCKLAGSSQCSQRSHSTNLVPRPIEDTVCAIPSTTNNIAMPNSVAEWTRLRVTTSYATRAQIGAKREGTQVQQAFLATSATAHDRALGSGRKLGQ